MAIESFKVTPSKYKKYDLTSLATKGVIHELEVTSIKKAPDFRGFFVLHHHALLAKMIWVRRHRTHLTG